MICLLETKLLTRIPQFTQIQCGKLNLHQASCTNGLSAIQNSRGVAMLLHRHSAHSWNQTKATQLIATHLNHWGMTAKWHSWKNGKWLVVFCNLQQFFGLQKCSSRIIGLFRLNNKAQCSLSSSLILKKWALRTWNLGQIFKIELWMVWLITQ